MDVLALITDVRDMMHACKAVGDKTFLKLCASCEEETLALHVRRAILLLSEFNLVL